MVRRTWRLLFGALAVAGLVELARLVGGGGLPDAVALFAVGAAAFAAVAHRRATARHELTQRVESEGLARILRGLSRSVSADSIIGAIVEDLGEAIGADHVVVVRRRRESDVLEATITTRRQGVPVASTVLPFRDGDGDADGAPTRRRDPVPIPIERPVVAVIGRLDAPTTSGVGPSLAAAAPGIEASRTSDRADRARDSGGALPALRQGTQLGARIGAVTRGALEAGGQLLRDVGLLRPKRVAPLAGPRSEVIGEGPGAQAASRIADRVRAAYGLSNTLAAPLTTDGATSGAIVVSRRDREPWSDAARRVLVGAAGEAAAALARADSYREATAQASTDPLTGLPNRRYFDEFMALLARRRRSGDDVAVLMIDIDKFKVLNDTYGHPVGDEVLKAVGGAIVAAVREEDVPARVGGEEFAVLLRNPGPEVANAIGERVRAAVRGLDLRAYGVPGVTVSVGVANASGAEEPIAMIVERADNALLKAKRAGRNRVVAA